MEQSLKSFVVELAPILSMTYFALYERQRALVRAGLLKVEAGRGTGSGVRATPESVATLLVAVLVTDDLSSAAELTRRFSRLKSDKPCRITHKTKFVDAVAEILRAKKRSAVVGVGRHDQRGLIFIP